MENLAAIEKRYDNYIAHVNRQPIELLVSDALDEARAQQQELLR